MEKKDTIFLLGCLICLFLSVSGCTTTGEPEKPVVPCSPGDFCDSGCQLQPDQMCCGNTIHNATTEDCCSNITFDRSVSLCCNGTVYKKDRYECLNGVIRTKVIPNEDLFPKPLYTSSSSHDEFRGLDPDKYPGPDSKTSKSTSVLDSSSKGSSVQGSSSKGPSALISSSKGSSASSSFESDFESKTGFSPSSFSKGSL